MQIPNNIAIVLPDVLPSSEKEDYMHGCCHIFALALAELTNLKIAAFLEKRAVFNNEDGTKSSIPLYYYNRETAARQYDEIGEGLVHAVCLVDTTSDLIFDALSIRNVSQLDQLYEIREDTYLKIYDDPNEILKFGHTFGERDKDVEDYVKLTKDYINTYLSDELKELKGTYGRKRKYRFDHQQSVHS